MKEGIHPKYEATKIICACGNIVATGSTKKDISVEICSNCHPFYTGESRVLDIAGKIEKFKRKYAQHQKKQ